MSAQIREFEEVLALEAAAHALATQELNPYAEAETLELGTSRAIYTGSLSKVHGVYACGVDGELEESDLKEIERFFAKKDRAPLFWISSATHPSWLEYFEKNAKKIKTQTIYYTALKDYSVPLTASGNNTPDLSLWSLRFAQRKNPQAKEADLFSAIKIHQKNTRFYLNESGAANYTFFVNGIAFSPASTNPELFTLQLKDAKDFGTKYFLSITPSLPQSYERNLYELI